MIFGSPRPRPFSQIQTPPLRGTGLSRELEPRAFEDLPNPQSERCDKGNLLKHCPLGTEPCLGAEASRLPRLCEACHEAIELKEYVVAPFWNEAVCSSGFILHA